jgi:hypothetical protein
MAELDAFDRTAGTQRALERKWRGARTRLASRGAPSGSHLVRFNGKAYEAVSATIERRRPLDLYHTGLEVRMGDASFVIEVAPRPILRADAEA